MSACPGGGGSITRLRCACRRDGTPFISHRIISTTSAKGCGGTVVEPLPSKDNHMSACPDGGVSGPSLRCACHRCGSPLVPRGIVSTTGVERTVSIVDERPTSKNNHVGSS